MSKKLLLTIPDQLFYKLLQHCEKKEMTKSEAIRQLLRDLPELEEKKIK